MNQLSKVKNTQVIKAEHGWRWHALGGNHKVLFHGAQVFSHKGRTIKFVINEWPHATTEVLDADGTILQVIEPTS